MEARAKARLLQDYANFNKIKETLYSNINIEPNEMNFFNWKILIKIKDIQPYSGIELILNLKFPNTFPKFPPEIFVMPVVYHLNINQKTGQLMMISLTDDSKYGWSSEQSVLDVIKSFYSVLKEPQPQAGCAADELITKEFLEDRITYEYKLLAAFRKLFPNKIEVERSVIMEQQSEGRTLLERKNREEAIEHKDVIQENNILEIVEIKKTTEARRFAKYLPSSIQLLWNTHKGNKFWNESHI